MEHFNVKNVGIYWTGVFIQKYWRQSRPFDNVVLQRNKILFGAKWFYLYGRIHYIIGYVINHQQACFLFSIGNR